MKNDPQSDFAKRPVPVQYSIVAAWLFIGFLALIFFARFMDGRDLNTGVPRTQPAAHDSVRQ